MISSTFSATTYGIKKCFNWHSFISSICAVYDLKKSGNGIEIEHDNWRRNWCRNSKFGCSGTLPYLRSTLVPAVKAVTWLSRLWGCTCSLPCLHRTPDVSTSTSIIVFNFHSSYKLLEILNSTYATHQTVRSRRLLIICDGGWKRQWGQGISGGLHIIVLFQRNKQPPH